MVHTDSANPTDYLKKMRKRDPQLAAFVGTNCPQVAMLAELSTKEISESRNPETFGEHMQVARQGGEHVS